MAVSAGSPKAKSRDLFSKDFSNTPLKKSLAGDRYLLRGVGQKKRKNCAFMSICAFWNAFY